MIQFLPDFIMIFAIRILFLPYLKIIEYGKRIHRFIGIGKENNTKKGESNSRKED
jgi:hypothetical protein